MNNKMNIIKKPELLAPAGDIERLKIALLYGADAVYIGGSMYSLRANAINFSIDEIKESVEFAHNLGKKIYVTVNIILHNEEIDLLVDYLKKLDSVGVDAIIVSDPTVVSLAKENTNLEIHISTQQSTINYESMQFWKNTGATRVVMGREVTKEELVEIKNKVDIEIECFIHGAMCASYSGRCVLSNFFTKRDSNRGGCSQICRWNFDLLTEDKEPLAGEKEFTFCTKDLSMLKYIPDMIDIGISSLKIEGRMRSIYYIATVVNIYRKVIDEYCSNPENYSYNEKYEKILRNCANRDSVPQFFNNIYDSSCQYYNGREEVSNQDFLGIILDYDVNTKMATIQQRNYFKVGDKIEIFGPNIDIIDVTIDKIWDDNNNEIDIVRHPKQIVKFRIDEQVYPNDLIRVKK
ncbi:MAG: U32 family peptidase [Bacilli bacterium]|nr:U32 family peptidase [Bacilli bacterium]MDD4607768.1 U32 family peptidase [Bacilli bacterium]